jgi:O-antigen/teichoic acid export membrane protein
VATDSAVLLFAALTYFNVSAFGFHVIVSRLLGAAQYGALGAVLVLTSLAGNATGAVTAAVTRTVAAAGGHIGDLRRLRRSGFIGSLLAGILVAALTPVLEGYLHLGSPVPIAFLAIMTAGVLAGLVPRGALMGERRFGPVAAALAAGATTKLILGALLTHLFGLSGAVAAAAAGEWVATGGYLWSCRAVDGATDLRIPLRSVTLATGAYGGFWLLAAADTFLARHLLGGTASGLYVAASTSGSIALFLPNNITLTAFPRLTGEDSRSVFAQAVAAASGLTLVTAGAMALLPGLVVAVLFGPDFKGAAALLTLLAVSNGAQGMVSLLVHHELARHRSSCLLPWVALVSLVVAANVAHHSGRQIAAEAMVVSLTLLVLMALATARPGPGGAQVGGGKPPDASDEVPAGFVEDWNVF